MQRKIRVVVIDDSKLFRAAISNGISKDPSIEVVGFAADPYEARDRIIQLQPDIVTLDVEMPKMNGVDFLRNVMPQYPLRAVVVSSLNGIVFDAMNAGALDFVSKPMAGSRNFEIFINELVEKLKVGATVNMRNRRAVRAVQTSSTPATSLGNVGSRFDGFIAIGASTGGTEATLEVLKNLPADVPGIVITQHMPPLFTKMYAERLNDSCAITVKEAREGLPITRGVAYIAPGEKHLTVRKSGSGYIVRTEAGAKVNGHCPSVDVLFESVAATAGKKSVGIILTGMGGDGAKGLLKMRQSGAFTIGQDEKTCVVYGMPAVAYNIGAVTKQVPISQVAPTLMNYLKNL